MRRIKNGRGRGRKAVRATLVAAALVAVTCQVLPTAEAQNVTSPPTRAPLLDLNEGPLPSGTPPASPLNATQTAAPVSAPGGASHNSTMVLTPGTPQAPAPSPTADTAGTPATPLSASTTTATTENLGVSTPSIQGGNTTDAAGSVPPATPSAPECGGLVCQNGSTCQAGNRTYNLDTDVGFHTVTNQNGYHCLCPQGFTGLDCSRPFQECDNQFNARCFHGGTCLPESDVEDVQSAAFCECSEAFYEGQRYAGKYCEVAVEENEYCPDQQGLFCLNGGSCPEGGARAPRVCKCRDGYFGQHCEFITPKGPECTLECFNEGVCRVGRINAPWGNSDDFYCDCPRGYGGIQCEHLSETCPDGKTVCLHGATCETSVNAEGTTEHFCACPDPYLGGSGCKEKRRMELCMPTLGPEYLLSMAVPAFCLNGGKCRDVMDGNVVYVQ